MLHKILKDFAGSQDGRITEQFASGTTVELSDYLASCIPADWARLVTEAKPIEIENKAVVSDGGHSTMKRKK